MMHSSEEGPQDVPPPPMPDMATLNANMERMINAAVARGRDPKKNAASSRSGSAGSGREGITTNRLPNPRFKGCWCCGKEGHNRQNCPEFADIKKKNGGKVPRDYVGAYERAMQKTSTSTLVKAIQVESLPAECEYAETFPLWPMLALPGSEVPVSNRFDGFNTDEESEDEEQEVLKALSQISAKVSKGLISQRERRARPLPALDTAHLKKVAQQVQEGIIKLPQIDLKDDESYHYVWALMDSGAGANVARRDQLPGSEPVAAPPIALTVASGDTLPNRGARKVTFINPDGSTRTRIFYEADVDMPILSVAEVSKEGSEGSEVSFRRKNGYVEDLRNCHRMPFIKRQGVYFVQLRIPKVDQDPDGHMSDFHRPAR